MGTPPPHDKPPAPRSRQQEGENQGWFAVTNKKKKQYNYPAGPPTSQHTRNEKTTASNSIPLGRPGQQCFLDDMGMAGLLHPGPSQQYRTPSQQQKAGKYRATQTIPT